jgi:phosphatidylglycerol:prolipoprotein diacylglycerol transferase
MHPILFKLGGITVYSYGFMIALGAIAGVAYMYRRGKKELGFTFDQANTLFLILFAAAFIGGKVFLFFESPGYFADNPGKLISGKGFVFYGSFLFAVPSMLWYFRKQKLPVMQMLDIMAITTCLVHMFGRIGCFLAGCCYGKVTDTFFGVVFTDPACEAEPKGVAIHPTQLYEAGYILLVMLFLLFMRDRKKFQGQLFLSYLALYAIGRFALEYFRGDEVRGFLIEGWISHSQAIALGVLATVLIIYRKVQFKSSR